MNIFSRTDPQTDIWTDSHPRFGQIHYARKPKLKRMHLQVIPFQGVMVSFPRRSSGASVHEFVESKTEWISKALQRSKQIEERSLAFFPTIIALQDTTVREGLRSRIDQLATACGFEYNTLSFRNQRSRWGSCSARNNISLNKNLFHLPDDLRDYVLLHELAHTREKNHSRQFWSILHDILGQAETIKRRGDLRDFEYLFYPPPT